MTNETTKPVVTQALEDRFWAKVDMGGPDECWRWQGPIHEGYGCFSAHGCTMKAHRWAFKLAKQEPIPGQPIDHICRNRACVNPAHLRQVDVKTNTLENSMAVTAINARKSACNAGHPLSGENLWINRRGWRICRECNRTHTRNTRLRQRSLRTPSQHQEEQ